MGAQNRNEPEWRENREGHISFTPELWVESHSSYTCLGKVGSLASRLCHVNNLFKRLWKNLSVEWVSEMSFSPQSQEHKHPPSAALSSENEPAEEKCLFGWEMLWYQPNGGTTWPAEGQVSPKLTRTLGCPKAGVGNVAYSKSLLLSPRHMCLHPHCHPCSWPRRVLTYPWGDQELPKHLKTQKFSKIFVDLKRDTNILLNYVFWQKQLCYNKIR